MTDNNPLLLMVRCFQKDFMAFFLIEVVTMKRAGSRCSTELTRFAGIRPARINHQCGNCAPRASTAFEFFSCLILAGEAGAVPERWTVECGPCPIAGLIARHFAVEPGPGVGPVAVGGRGRDAQHPRRLLQREPGKEAQFDEFGLGRILSGQLRKRTVEVD